MLQLLDFLFAQLILYARIYIMNSVSKPAFTLAEVLITLAIIGVVAAMTIPALTNKTNKQELVVGLKKSYEVLSQVAYRIKADNGGDLSNALNNLSSDSDHDGLANVFISKLNVAKNCGIDNALNSGCWTNQTITQLNGSTAMNFVDSGGYFSTILTNDNISYAFQAANKNCTQDNSGGNPSSPLYNSLCGQVYVDVNGPNKGPLQYGRDIFRFWITKNGVFPMGTGRSDVYTNCSTTGSGNACATRIMMEGAMNY